MGGMCEDKGAERCWWSELSLCYLCRADLVSFLCCQFCTAASGSNWVLPLGLSLCAWSCQHSPSVLESLCTENAAAASVSSRGVLILRLYTRRKLHIALVFFLFRLWGKKNKKERWQLHQSLFITCTLVIAVFRDFSGCSFAF